MGRDQLVVGWDDVIRTSGTVAEEWLRLGEVGKNQDGRTPFSENQKMECESGENDPEKIVVEP